MDVMEVNKLTDILFSFLRAEGSIRTSDDVLLLSVQLVEQEGVSPTWSTPALS